MDTELWRVYAESLNNRWDYSYAVYSGWRGKILLKCKLCGEFTETTPHYFKKFNGQVNCNHCKKHVFDKQGKIDWWKVFDYKDGELFWKIKTSRNVLIGDKAGRKAKDHYKTFRFNGDSYYVHRVIWEMHNGPIPEGMQIDHIDQNKFNNRIENLRLVDGFDNHKNMPLLKNNTSGCCGVSLRKKLAKWRAFISVNGSFMELGYYDDWFEAVCARKSAENRLGFHENHGKHPKRSG